MKQNLLLLFTALVFLFLGIFLGRNLFRTDAPAVTNECTGGEPFMPFLQKFHSDIRFQQQRTLFPMPYVTNNSAATETPDTFLIERSSWVPIEVFDSAGTVVQVFPATTPDSLPNPCAMTVTLDGIHHGLKATLRFALYNKVWHLESFEDFSF